MDKTSLTSRVVKTELIPWQQLKYIQQNDFKELDPEAKEHLKHSILVNQFTQPFYVWQEEKADDIYCLDGRHRTFILEELKREGHAVPDLLPATFIHCDNKKQAAELVLIYSSIYARITQQGLFDFLQMYEIEYESIASSMHIPDFSTQRFEHKFDLWQTAEAEEPEVEVSEDKIIVRPGDIFQLNDHRIACGSFGNDELAAVLMDGKQARIVNTDPPFNLSAKFILTTNQPVTKLLLWPKQHSN